MKNYLAILGLGVVLVGCGSAKQSVNDLAVSNPIVTALDLTAVNNDRVPVTINPGRFTTETVTYRLPRVVQGTYSVSDFGKYVDDFKALDYDGNELSSTKVDDNTWTITDATKLDKIQYYVNDTFDTETSGAIGGEEPFSPAGTNIESDNFVLNLHGFIGYFDSLKNSQYAVDVTAPANFVRTSALEDKGVKSSENGTVLTSSYFAQRYFDITDNPMMYGKLDVEEFMVGDIKIVLSLYSPTGKHTAASLKETVYKMMEAQKKYLGDVNSTPRYDIYVYLSRGDETSPKGFGALEHHTSTVAVFGENESLEDLKASMIDVVSHEFFHIVTPLSVHSEDIHYFDYNKPTFSKHLWMYEGVTEYFAQHFQVHEGLVDEATFYNTIKSKIDISTRRLDDAMSFTIMSENVLNEPYASQYYNVYMKGALMGMCIDILMRKESDGNRSMLSLMKELSAKYGKEKPFEDDKLISEITAMTYPSVGEFLKTHVEGDVPINYNEFFAMVGLKMGETQVETNYIFAGGQNVIFDGDQEKGIIFFSPMAEKNSFWKSQGVKAGDVIKKVNGTDLTLANAQGVIGGMFGWEEGQEITMDLERDGKPMLIKATLTKAYAADERIVEDENATEAQKALRAAWLKG
ncbi:putative metalloprotease with PDZ domain [Winogradskyella eximia]|uniref:Putative metalloprotease with PDZ domain n=1 Tax=Winogradskyella eximia TaxID=262006 RepID=A0A3D9H1T6_9FLAO|nr:peptidase M61 [Winogradskyella eximia]RED43458.1 putative metalloprotease with PDZ domain [Winogradskyella eximia]